MRTYAVRMETRIDHVGVVVTDMHKALEDLERCFALVPGRTLDIPERGVHATFVGWGDVSVELIEISGRPASAGVHHLGVAVSDLDAAFRAVTDGGMTTATPEPQLIGGRRTIFVRSGGLADVVIQLVEEPLGERS
jgi:hypothetical protein